MLQLHVRSAQEVPTIRAIALPWKKLPARFCCGSRRCSVEAAILRQDWAAANVPDPRPASSPPFPGFLLKKNGRHHGDSRPEVGSERATFRRNYENGNERWVRNHGADPTHLSAFSDCCGSSPYFGPILDDYSSHFPSPFLLKDCSGPNPPINETLTTGESRSLCFQGQ